MFSSHLALKRPMFSSHLALKRHKYDLLVDERFPSYFVFGREGNEAFVDDDFEVAIKVNGFKIIRFPSLCYLIT